MQITHQLHKEPLQEMIHQYFRAKKSGIQLHSRMKYLKSDVKRKKDSLWKSVKKEISAKVFSLFYILFDMYIYICF